MGKQFGVFKLLKSWPLYRDFFAGVEQARRRAQEVADAEGWEYLVVNFKEHREVARFYPPLYSAPKRVGAT